MRMSRKEQEQGIKPREIKIYSEKLHKDDYSYKEFETEWCDISEKNVNLLKEHIDKKIKVHVSHETVDGEHESDFLEGNVNGVLKNVEVDKVVLLVESEEGDHSRYELGEREIYYKDVCRFHNENNDGYYGGATYLIDKIEVIGKDIVFLFFCRH